MGLLSKLFGKRPAPPRDDRPFLEHPSGEFVTALLAIRSAMERLEREGMGGRWIIFSAQGQGGDIDSCRMSDVPFSGCAFDLSGQTLELEAVLESAGLGDAGLAIDCEPNGKVSLPGATPEQLARFLDALFRTHFGIRPFDGEEDYGVGAEWK